jgi:hypothetical protein
VAPLEVQIRILNGSRHSETLWRLFIGIWMRRPRQKDRKTAMEWTYKISASARPKVLMRVVQVFDQQSMPMRRCVLEECGELLEIEIVAEMGEDLARRIQAKLYKLVDLLEVDLIVGRVAVDALLIESK